MKTRRQRACAGFVAFSLVLVKGTAGARDLERLGFSHMTAEGTIKDLVEGGMIGGRGSPSYATVTDQALENLRGYIEDNPKTRWAAAHGVVKILGLDRWPEKSRENFYRMLQEWVDDASRGKAAAEVAQVVEPESRRAVGAGNPDLESH